MIKEAFHLCMQGYGPTQIAKEFSKRCIMNPTARAKANGINIRITGAMTMMISGEVEQ